MKKMKKKKKNVTWCAKYGEKRNGEEHHAGDGNQGK